MELPDQAFQRPQYKYGVLPGTGPVIGVAGTDSPSTLSAHCQGFKGADLRRSVLQLSISAILFFAAIAVMIVAQQRGFVWIDILLSVPVGGLLVRLFIIQHDCGHGSFFRSKKMNDALGRAISVLTLTPYDCWKRAHNLHHAASGNLDQRGVGGIDTLTVREYLALPRFKRILYRIYRHPLTMLVFGTPFHVIFIQRIPFFTMAPFYESYRSVPSSQIWRSIVALDVAMAALYGSLAFTFGWHVLVWVFLPVVVVTAWIGGWLFFVQHQFEDSYWQPGQNWEFRSAALQGSSYYVLPPVLQWFTGNIGLHHIHHLCSAIPNYRLQECLDKNETLRQLNRMTIRDSLKCLQCSLWDEERQQMIGFHQLALRAAENS